MEIETKEMQRDLSGDMLSEEEDLYKEEELYKMDRDYIYHDGSYALDGAPGGQCRRSVCAEYLHFNEDGSIRFIPLTQEGLSVNL